MKPLRALYDWVLRWAATPYGAVALFVLALSEASFFPVPPDVLLLAVCLARPRRSLHYALLCTTGSVLGGMIGYGIGWGVWEMLSGFFFTYVPGFTPEVFQRVANLYQEWDFWAVSLAGLTPIPYKVFTIAAGAFGLNFPTFVLASFLSRGLRFGIEGWLILRFGPPMAGFIDRYFNWLTLLFAVLLVGGFVVLRYLV
ncbi:MAG: DedA family protein [Acidobacteria bacterium]|nr:DedA family protein [Acidobacteriota bacterium]